MKKNALKMALTITAEKGCVLRPITVKVSHQPPSPSIEASHHAPFKYYTDAIIGLCYHKMTDFKHSQADGNHFTENAYRSLNPYLELFRKSSPRVQALGKPKPEQKLQVENFEKSMDEAWSKLFTAEHMDLTTVPRILNLISDFENQLAAPLLYNLSLQFSERFTEKLISFYSLLFHLRSVVAIDHNAYVHDSSIDTVKCDSISDYLPKSDYTANDALLFWQFKKLSIPFVAHKDKDVRIEKLLVQPLEKYFYQYNHNACCLIDQLPTSFLNSVSTTDLEDTLHHVQMDWLLGSASGLLFKIREEVFGLIEGYDKVFWPESLHHKPKSATQLKLVFEINQNDLTIEPHAA